MTSPREDQAAAPAAGQPAAGANAVDQAPVATPPQAGAPQAGTPQAAAPVRPHVVHRTRIGGMWVGLGVAAIVLLLLLIFILENSKSVDIGYFGAHGHLPLGVALLLSAVAGALLVLIPGTGRILQLRKVARRHRAREAKTLQAAQQAAQQAGTATPGSAPPQ
jgi:uncharacterized integral membrane protein